MSIGTPPRPSVIPVSLPGTSGRVLLAPSFAPTRRRRRGRRGASGNDNGNDGGGNGNGGGGDDGWYGGGDDEDADGGGDDFGRWDGPAGDSRWFAEVLVWYAVSIGCLVNALQHLMQHVSASSSTTVAAAAATAAVVSSSHAPMTSRPNFATISIAAQPLPTPLTSS